VVAKVAGSDPVNACHDSSYGVFVVKRVQLGIKYVDPVGGLVVDDLEHDSIVIYKSQKIEARPTGM
jgi:hypothetical protein